MGVSGTRTSATRLERLERHDRPEVGFDARRRAAIELIARHESSLKRTARRFSLDREDADDAYQRALEIVLTKAPTTDPGELIRWTQTVTKHEALALRKGRERLLGKGGDDARDPVASLPSGGDGPDERVERREDLARSREALRTLKPAELRALGLLAEGYSYAEIGEITGFSQTKVNRVLAEGRSRFRDLVSSSEDGTRCRQLRPLLSAFCDGEAGPADSATVREHLRACAHCRATMRAYRRAPRAAAALVPVLPAAGPSLLDRARDLLDGLASRLPGSGTDSAAQGVAASGAGAGGMAGVAKVLVACVATAGAGAACVATGVVQSPVNPGGGAPQPALEREAGEAAATPSREATRPDPPHPAKAEHRSKRQERREIATPASVATETVEYEAPAPAPAPEPAPEPPPPAETAPAPEPAPAPSGGSAAGEFGP